MKPIAESPRGCLPAGCSKPGQCSNPLMVRFSYTSRLTNTRIVPSLSGSSLLGYVTVMLTLPDVPSASVAVTLIIPVAVGVNTPSELTLPLVGGTTVHVVTETALPATSVAVNCDVTRGDRLTAVRLGVTTTLPAAGFAAFAAGWAGGVAPVSAASAPEPAVKLTPFDTTPPTILPTVASACCDKAPACFTASERALEAAVWSPVICAANPVAPVRAALRVGTGVAAGGFSRLV